MFYEESEILFQETQKMLKEAKKVSREENKKIDDEYKRVCVEKAVGNIDTVIYACGGDHGGFLYPGDAILGNPLIIKDSDINRFGLPDYWIKTVE
jgi:hypothetical protein